MNLKMKLIGIGLTFVEFC